MIRRIFFLIVILLIASSTWATDYTVTAPVTAAKIETEIAKCIAGDTVIVTNGTWSGLSTITIPTNIDGTEGSPITLRPQTPGGAVFNGNTGRPLIQVGGDWWVIQDNDFDTISETGTTITKVIFVDGADGVRITNNRFHDIGINSSGWNKCIYYSSVSDADNGRVDHNTFDGVRGGGVLFDDSSASPVVNYNSFKDFYDDGNNGRQAIHIGNTTSTDQNALVEYNLFDNMNAEPETVSNKSSSNTYQYNHFRNGSNGIILRGGDDCIVDGNYFFNPGDGVNNNTLRVHGAGHKLINNYIEGATGDSAIILPNGGSGYEQTEYILIANNTFVGSIGAYTIWLGFNFGGTGPWEQVNNITFKSNIVTQSQGKCVQLNDGASIDWIKNLHFTTGSATYWGGSGEPSAPDITKADPNLIQGTYIQRLQVTSINAIGNGATDANVTDDIDGGSRDGSTPDIGCDEYNTGGSRIPITDGAGHNWSVPTIVSSSPSGTLTFRTTQLIEAVYDEVVNVRWSLVNEAYADMSDTFTDTDDTHNSTMVSVSPGVNTFYVAGIDVDTNASVTTAIVFTVGAVGIVPNTEIVRNGTAVIGE